MSLHRLLALTALSLLLTTACGGSPPAPPVDNTPDAGPIGGSDGGADSGVPATVPGAPTSVTATAGNAQATVSWQTPADTGGRPITHYTLISSPSSAPVTLSADTLSATVTGLTNGTPYTFVVFASNAVGQGQDSAPSNAVTPATVPGAPTQVSATAGENSAVVTWSAPVDNGGSALTGYQVSASPASAPVTVGAGSTSASVTGLTTGAAYTFTVQALNAVGASVPSSPSNSVTPRQRVQVSIDFDNLPNATAVTNQYPQLTLSSATGLNNSTLNLAATFKTSVPNILCTPGCDEPTYIDFTRPARDVKFKAVGVNDTNQVFAVRVHRQGLPVTRLEYTGQGLPYEPLLVDLSALGDITRVELVEITDTAGVGWDDFSFTVLQ